MNAMGADGHVRNDSAASVKRKKITFVVDLPSMEGKSQAFEIPFKKMKLSAEELRDRILTMSGGANTVEFVDQLRTIVPRLIYDKDEKDKVTGDLGAEFKEHMKKNKYTTANVEFFGTHERF